MPYKPKRPLPQGTHPLVALMFSEMERQDIGPRVLGEMSGVNGGNIQQWREMVKPSLFQLECCLNALGFELKAERKNKLG